MAVQLNKIVKGFDYIDTVKCDAGFLPVILFSIFTLQSNITNGNQQIFILTSLHLTPLYTEKNSFHNLVFGLTEENCCD